MQKRKKLPIGKQTFRKIRDPKDSYIYIDKTEDALKMIDGSNDYYFLSRPRRFGKSLFLDTLSEIFLGHKEYFEGLYIYDKYDWTQSYPVIKIDFTGGALASKELIENNIRENIKESCRQYQISFEKEIENIDPGTMLKKLISILYKKDNAPVVLLIDEYDKPIIDNISNDKKDIALEARDVLRGFYAAIKGADAYLRFVFLTGVSKFSKLNLFSGLNNIEDITINKSYSTITGYTHEDLQNHFSEYLDGVDLKRVKQWYNGYNYFGTPIYNPFDILLFLSNSNQFRNYWWQTGGTKFLVDKLSEGNYHLPNLENITVSEETLNTFDVEHIELTALLWQTGYLTFDKEIDRGGRISYKMKVPNTEVQISLNALFLDYLTSLKAAITEKQNNAYDAIIERNFNALENEIRILFASIPADNYRKNSIGDYEGYYASVIYAFMASLGFVLHAEDTSNTGRADLTLVGANEIFIFEFKVDAPEEAALHQIKTKRYFEKYLNQGKEIYLVGVHFESKNRNIASLKWEKYDI